MEKEFFILLAAFFCIVVAQDPTVRFTDTDPRAKVKDFGFTQDSMNGGLIQVRRDRDVTMSCYVENKQPDTLVRYQMYYVDTRGQVQVRKISSDTSVEDNTKYSIEKPTQFTWKLRIKSIQLTEQGNYTCFVYTTRQNKKEANMTVTVLVPPTLIPTQTSSDTIVKEGDSLELLCNASGIPPPTIEWTRLGGALLPIGKERHYDPKLSLYRIQPEDRGKYMCRVYNIIDTIERTVVLDVRFKPIVRPMQPVVSQAPGYLIELQCYVEANPFPTPDQLMWRKGTRAMSVNSGRFRVRTIQGAFNRLTYELIINGVKEEDYGTYECRIRNAQGSSSGSVQLRRSNGARPSQKLGIIIKGDACAVSRSSVAITLSLIAAWVLHR